jgi:hypothetical protein
MVNYRETSNCNNQVDKFTEALATARQMQQDWLTYGLDFVHIYFEDVDGDWLETWKHEEINGNSILHTIKEFLVSDDDVAISIRQHLGERSLFDIAVKLEEILSVPESDYRLSAVKNLLAADMNSVDTEDVELLHLANSLLAKFAEIL